MLKQRVIFGILGVILAIAILVFCPVIVVGIFVGIISLIALNEFYSVTSLSKGKSPAVLLGYVFSLLYSVLAIFYPDAIFKYFVVIIAGYVFLSMIVMVLFHDKCSFNKAALSFLGVIYIVVFFGHALFIRQLEYGKALIWVLFIAAWSTDTFAYVFGRTIGKHKLCPRISPKKTVEGAIGGILGCILCVAVYVYFVANYSSYEVNYTNVVFLAIAASVFSQIGDLAASCIKREHNVKDYGNLIPGHGGILDRFDSVLLISPIVYYFMEYLPVLV